MTKNKVIEVNLNKRELISCNPGSIITGNTETNWIVYRHDSDGTTKLLRRYLLDKHMSFSMTSNNFVGSNVEKYLNTHYIKECMRDFEEENILWQNVDLISLTGYTDYGTHRTKIIVPTFDDYRFGIKNGIIKEHMAEAWWLSTADTVTKDDKHLCCSLYVTEYGTIGSFDYDCVDLCLRPMISVPSTILVSHLEEI